MGWPMGLEPTTTGITTPDSTFELRPPLTGLPGGTRTHNPQLRRLVLYPVELRAAGQNAKTWSGREDLNLRHPAPKAGALPVCATPRKLAANDTLSASLEQRDSLATGVLFCYKSAPLF